ncbi:hypothetical protein QMK22_00255 [Cryobacterium sp. PH29-G1]|nr:hypothetical protein [Cryobacterium sp. PH29-G1]
MRKSSLWQAAERGSSMLAVIGLMAVAGVATLAIAGSTMNSLGVSSAARAGVQAQAAAEGGIDAGLLMLSMECTGLVDGILPTTDSRARVTISHLDTGSASWVKGCPTTTGQVKITSEGTAADLGIGGNSTGNTRTVEAIYSVDTSGSATSSGIAIYAHVGFSVIESVTIQAKASAIYVRNGNASCISSGANSVDIIVKSGDVTLGESCGVFGDVWASGAASIGGSAIVHQSLIASSLKTVSTAQVSGNVWVSGLAAIGAGTKIGGTLTAGSITGTVGTLLGGLTGTLLGTKPAPVSGITDPGWFELNYKYNKKQKQDHWESFEKEYEIAGVCDLAKLQTAADSFAGRPGIIECPAGVDVASAGVLTLGSDVAIIAESFKFRNSAQINAAAKHKLWLVTPDGSPNSKPTCNAHDEDFSVSESFKVNVNVDVMVYTPCNVNISTSSQWRGQIWAGGTVKFGTSGVYTYVEVGFPGAASSAGTVALGARESIRDLND